MVLLVASGVDQRHAVPVEPGEGDVFYLVVRRINQKGVRGERFRKNLRGVHHDQRIAGETRLRGTVNHRAIRRPAAATCR